MPHNGRFFNVMITDSQKVKLRGSGYLYLKVELLDLTRIMMMGILYPICTKMVEKRDFTKKIQMPTSRSSPFMEFMLS